MLLLWQRFILYKFNLQIYMKIYDCFMFFDEEMLLDLRLNIMDKYVDKFVITEATYTHSGNSKKLIFDINKFSKFKDKIIYNVVDKQPTNIEEINNSDDIDSKGRKLIHNSIKRENYQRDIAKKFLNSILIIIKQFITDYGFSYGYSDLELSEKDREAILNDINETYNKVYDLTDQLNKKTLSPMRGMTREETAEALITYELAKARDRAGITANSNLSDDNAGKIMATTGARGSALNVGQMAGALGQQSRRGKRLHTGFSNRTLSHFKENDHNPDSHGFVKSNFRDGLSTLEFFFHARPLLLVIDYIHPRIFLILHLGVIRAFHSFFA